ncbi:putative peptidoglycan glycosyltransferase FtsW [Thomasclavelia spiroformis]|uniref:FtsW/RodA/SpoVE family cell cycle protein n=1 Tax=Thomasclavelia spiroformis TaxID=29348 RepID=UPI002942DF81|nr:putative peptidoglycan glycosyltransferase FtsW [Thomasclavelia spiroformis]
MKSKRVVILVMTIVFIGLMMVYSASNIWAGYKFNDSLYYIKRQALFAVIGIIAMFIFSKIDYHIYQKKANKILIFCFILMILVLIPGLGSVRGGSRSWFNLGIISLQPSELFKIAIIIYSASYISNHYHELKKLKASIKLLVVLSLGFGLIMLQPDFGSGFVMVCSIIVMLIVSPFPFKYFIMLGILGVIGIVLMIISAPYRLARIVAFLNPFADPLGSGFQIIQSLYAIAPGGILGVGFNNSVQKHFYLPEPQTDFIFAIYLEEFGLIGGIFLVGLYGYLFITVFNQAMKVKDLFGSFLMIGIISMIGIQTLINLGVVVGLFPVTGVTLYLRNNFI